MSKNYNKKKSEQLGMPFGTAMARLRKDILFSLVKKLNMDNCYRCGNKITNIESFSIEHKEYWLDNSVDLFWDLKNIAFSHIKCNIAGRRKTNRIEWPDGMQWCSGCQDFRSVDDFSNCFKGRNKRGNFCRKCNWVRVKRQREKKKLEKGKNEKDKI